MDFHTLITRSRLSSARLSYSYDYWLPNVLHVIVRSLQVLVNRQDTFTGNMLYRVTSLANLVKDHVKIDFELMAPLRTLYIELLPLTPYPFKNEIGYIIRYFFVAAKFHNILFIIIFKITQISFSYCLNLSLFDWMFKNNYKA